jgi:uncharacterized protein YprB with RNaseH-like and TPR domain
MPKTARLVAWDIECTGLKADFSYLLCAAFGVVGEKKVKLLSLKDYGDTNLFKNERDLVKDVIAEMGKADALVGYYTTGFDHPFINAKALEYGLDFPAPTPKIDLYYTAKSNLALSRKSMQNVAYFADVEHGKSPVEGRLWKAAMAGDLSALREVEKHNIADIEVLRDVYYRLRPLIRTHPYVTEDRENCRTCGGPVIFRGPAISKLKGRQQKVQCKDCGSYETRPVAA